MLKFSTYNAALLATAQINLAKRLAGIKVSQEPLPTIVTKSSDYQIPTPDKAEYAAKVVGAVETAPVVVTADAEAAVADVPK